MLARLRGPESMRVAGGRRSTIATGMLSFRPVGSVRR
jgi:hypothetical protein